MEVENYKTTLAPLISLLIFRKALLQDNESSNAQLPESRDKRGCDAGQEFRKKLFPLLGRADRGYADLPMNVHRP